MTRCAKLSGQSDLGASRPENASAKFSWEKRGAAWTPLAPDLPDARFWVADDTPGGGNQPWRFPEALGLYRKRRSAKRQHDFDVGALFNTAA